MIFKGCVRILENYTQEYTEKETNINVLSTSQILEAEGCCENKLIHVPGELSVLNNVREMPIWKLISLNLLKPE